MGLPRVKGEKIKVRCSRLEGGYRGFRTDVDESESNKGDTGKNKVADMMVNGQR